jgi:hypothetical protein
LGDGSAATAVWDAFELTILTLTDDTDLENFRVGDLLDNVSTAGLVMVSGVLSGSDTLDAFVPRFNLHDPAKNDCFIGITKVGDFVEFKVPTAGTLSLVVQRVSSISPEIDATGDYTEPDERFLATSTPVTKTYTFTSSGVLRYTAASASNGISLQSINCTFNGALFDVTAGVKVIAINEAAPSITTDGGSWSNGETITGPTLAAGRGTVTAFDSGANTIDYTLVGGRFIGGEGKIASVGNPIGINGFHLPFSDNSTVAALGTDTSGAGNDWTVNNIIVDSVPSSGPWLTGFRTAGPQGSWNSGTPITTLQSGSTHAITNNNNALKIDTQELAAYNLTVTRLPGGDSMYIVSSDDPATYSQTIHSTGTNGAIAVNSSGTSSYNFKRYISFEGSGNGSVTLQITGTVGDSALIDSLLDSPTNGTQTDTGAGGEVRGNYATLNPLKKGDMTLSNGNLDIVSTGSYALALGTIGVSSGKWYFESTINNSNTSNAIGIAKDGADLNAYPGANDSLSWVYLADGRKVNGGTRSSYGDSYGSGDVIGVALDADGGNLYFYKNGVVQNSGTAAYTGLTSGPYFPCVADDSNGNQMDQSLNFGQRPFAYTAPSGFKALCTTNLSDPTIADGSTAMDAVTYVGNGGTQTISGLNFSPSLVWYKSRNNAGNHALFDIVRGATKRLISNDTAAEDTRSGVTSFNSDGWTEGSFDNQSGYTYVGWTWDAGSSTVTNTDGSITSQVRANPTAGFSIVGYTGTFANATVGHGLGVAPSMIIIKERSQGTGGWIVYHASIGSGGALYLNLTQQVVTTSSFFNSTSPTSTVFSLGSNGEVNDNGETNIAYCWAPVEGYSAFGSYTGNGISEGPFIYTGFRPAFIIYKSSTNSGASDDWYIRDYTRLGYNAFPDVNNNPDLEANSTDSENNNGPVDILSNGFKIRNNNPGHNDNNASYIWAAFAEHPFKIARAR